MPAEEPPEGAARQMLVIEGAGEGMDLVLCEGEVLAVLGPPGSGKSALLQVAGGMRKPAQGRVWLAGHELEAGEGSVIEALKPLVGWVLPEPDLDPLLTVEETVLLGAQSTPASSPTQARTTARLALDALGLMDKAAVTVGGLGPGEVRLTAIALALAKQPAVVIADEPVRGLEETVSIRVHDLLREAADSGSAVIFATTDRQAAERADRILELPRPEPVVAGGRAGEI